MWAKQKIQTGISHYQSVGAQMYKRTCITVWKVLSHNAIKIFASYQLCIVLREIV